MLNISPLRTPESWGYESRLKLAAAEGRDAEDTAGEMPFRKK